MAKFTNFVFIFLSGKCAFDEDSRGFVEYYDPSLEVAVPEDDSVFLVHSEPLSFVLQREK